MSNQQEPQAQALAAQVALGKHRKVEKPNAVEAQDSPDDDCPIAFLGYQDGKHRFVNPQGHHIALTPHKLGQWAELLTLFGSHLDWLKERFPPSSSTKKQLFDLQEATAWLVQKSVSVHKDALPRFLRQSGVWPDPSGNDKLLIHLGDEVLVGGKMLPVKDVPLSFGCTRGSAGLEWADQVGTVQDAIRVKEAASTFHFASHEQLDLFLGWLGASFYAGALSWRPHIYVTAPRGSGKSTLIRVAKAVLGSAALLAGQDVSAAFLRQQLNGRACAVLLDEAEGGEHNKIEAILRIARHASDGEGAVTGRGTTSGIAQDFFFAGTFMFAGIHEPSLAPQDRTRIAQLALRPALAGSYRAADYDRFEHNVTAIETRSAPLFRYMIERYPHFRMAERAYRAILQDHFRTTPRFAIQAAALLAGYDTLFLSTHRTKNVLLFRTREILPALRSAMAVDEAEPGEQVLQVLASKVPSFLGPDQNKTVVELINAAVQSPTRGDAIKLIRRIGLNLPPIHPGFLAIAYNHSGLDQIFAGTQWTQGRWVRPLTQLPDVHRDPSPTSAFGPSTRVVLIPLRRLISQQ